MRACIRVKRFCVIGFRVKNYPGSNDFSLVLAHSLTSQGDNIIDFTRMEFESFTSFRRLSAYCRGLLDACETFSVQEREGERMLSEFHIVACRF